MPNVVDVTNLLQGPRHTIVQVYLENDGYSGELKNEVLLDPVLDLGLNKKFTRFVVEEILFHFAGFDATLKFDTGLVDKFNIWVLPEGAANYVDLRPFGGFKDRSGPDGNGKLLLSTNGFTNNNAKGSLLLKVRIS